jgi:pimeloyl-ACP methyl ester carboxylesterase
MVAETAGADGRILGRMHLRERPGSPTLLWLHGLGESGRCFEAIAAHPALAGAGALIPDLPGYGRSERPPSPLPLVAIADHLAGWLAARGAPPVVVVGHSMGGVIGVHLAERHPARVARLVDVDGNVSLGDCTYSGRAAAFDDAGFAARGFAEMVAYVDDRAISDAAHRSYAISIRLADPATFLLHARELVSESEPETMAARLAALSVPVTYVAGAPGGACPRTRELLDGAGIATIAIEPAGHWPYLDQPDGFAAALAGLL